MKRWAVWAYWEEGMELVTTFEHYRDAEIAALLLNEMCPPEFSYRVEEIPSFVN